MINTVISNMAPQIEQLTESFGLGEAPHWDPETQTLYFVDFVSQNILRYNPATKKLTKGSAAPEQPTFILPVEGKKNQFVISSDRDIALVFWDGENDKVVVEKILATVDKPPNKLNDAKCDSSGRLWTGTLDIVLNDWDQTPAVGTLYSYDSKQKLKTHADQIGLTNGLDFNDKIKKMFYIDTLKGTVDAFDLDVASGTITNRQVWFTLAKNNVPGRPDGMTIDSDGNLWVAAMEGGRVIKVDGYKTETLLDTVLLPAQQVTSVAFGGKNYDELYVTTACFEHKGKKPPAPVNGALYKVTGLGVKGLPANNFRLD